MMQAMERQGGGCMVSSSKETPSTLDFDKDQSLTFNCYQFERIVRSGRRSGRHVIAKDCLCTNDIHKICEPGLSYTINFREGSNEEMVQWRRELSEKNLDISPDRIGPFNTDRVSTIYVSPHFMDVLWPAASRRLVDLQCQSYFFFFFKYRQGALLTTSGLQ
jgi:hypothetical protein